MNSAVYNNFRKLLEKWPLDHTKKGRDFGEYIRVAVGANFRRAGTNVSLIETVSSSIKRISSDYYNNTFYVSNKSSSSGLSEAECQQAVSNEFLKYLEEKEKKTLSSKITGSIK